MEMEEKVSQGQENQYLTFVLGSEMFGMDIHHTKEIIRYGGLTKIPRVPGFIRGVLNLRGNVVPVLDIKALFGGAASEITKHTCIVIVEIDSGKDRMDIGIMVDAVNEVINIRSEDIEPPPSFGTSIHTDFINGMGRLEDKFIILLNANKLLDVDEIAQIGRMTRTAIEDKQSVSQPVS